MKHYRRILVPVISDRHLRFALQRAAELAQFHGAQLMVLKVIDTRSGFEPDGPAARLPGESAARRAPALKKRLDLLLASNNLAGAEACVAWGEPNTVIADAISKWQPDLIVASGSCMPTGIGENADILAVRPQRSLFGRISASFQQFVPRHA